MSWNTSTRSALYEPRVFFFFGFGSQAFTAVDSPLYPHSKSPIPFYVRWGGQFVFRTPSSPHRHLLGERSNTPEPYYSFARAANGLDASTTSSHSESSPFSWALWRAARALSASFAAFRSARSRRFSIRLA